VPSTGLAGLRIGTILTLWLSLGAIDGGLTVADGPRLWYMPAGGRLYLLTWIVLLM